MVVLNADWHHGDGHKHQGTEHREYRLVLNADWHHGDGHAVLCANCTLNKSCSTPIGITGTGTSGSRLTA